MALFIAKAVFDIPTTRALIERLQVDRTLRRLCGWTYSRKVRLVGDVSA